VTIKEIHTHIFKREERQKRKGQQSRRRKTFSWTNEEWDVMRNSSPDTIDDDDEVNVILPRTLIAAFFWRGGKLLT
jgi:hypothetical protein